MIHLRKTLAAVSVPVQTRRLDDPLLDPRTAAYLEPATLPLRRSEPRGEGSRLLRWLRGPSRSAPRPYPRLWMGFVCLLFLLLYLLSYAQDAGRTNTPYLVVPPPDSHAAQFLVVPAGSIEPVLPLPVTGQ